MINQNPRLIRDLIWKKPCDNQYILQSYKCRWCIIIISELNNDAFSMYLFSQFLEMEGLSNILGPWWFWWRNGCYSTFWHALDAGSDVAWKVINYVQGRFWYFSCIPVESSRSRVVDYLIAVAFIYVWQSLTIEFDICCIYFFFDIH